MRTAEHDCPWCTCGREPLRINPDADFHPLVLLIDRIAPTCGLGRRDDGPADAVRPT